MAHFNFDGFRGQQCNTFHLRQRELVRELHVSALEGPHNTHHHLVPHLFERHDVRVRHHVHNLKLQRAAAVNFHEPQVF